MRTQILTKTMTLANFDGSTNAKKFYLPAVEDIIAIYAQLNFLSSPAATRQCYAQFKLQAFTGAVIVGGAWSDGAWADLVIGEVSISHDGAAAFAHFARDFRCEPAFPMRTGVKNIVDEVANPGLVRRFVAPNTHANPQVAGETDLACFFSVLGGANAQLNATVNIVVPA